MFAMCTTAASASPVLAFEDVYTGFWMNWSNGFLLAATWSLRAEYAILLTSSLTLLLFAATTKLLINGTQWWYESMDARMLRSSTGRTKLELPSKYEPDGCVVSQLPRLQAVSYAFTIFIAIVIPSHLVGLWKANSAALIQLRTHDYRNDSNTAKSRHSGPQSTIDASILVDYHSVDSAPSQLAILNNASCPFGNEACFGLNDIASQFDTGLLNSDAAFGINAQSRNRVSYRRVTTCAPFNGEALENSSFSLVFFKDSFGLFWSVNASAEDSGGSWTFYPALLARELNPDAEIILIGSTGGASPTRDETGNALPTLASGPSSRSDTGVLLQTDHSLFGCMEQHQFCNTKGAQCTHLSGTATLLNNLAAGSNTSFNALQTLTIRMLLYAAQPQSLSNVSIRAIASNFPRTYQGLGFKNSLPEAWREHAQFIFKSRLVEFRKRLLGFVVLGERKQRSLPTPHSKITATFRQAQKIPAPRGIVSISICYLVAILLYCLAASRLNRNTLRTAKWLIIGVHALEVIVSMSWIRWRESAALARMLRPNHNELSLRLAKNLQETRAHLSKYVEKQQIIAEEYLQAPVHWWPLPQPVRRYRYKQSTPGVSRLLVGDFDNSVQNPLPASAKSTRANGTSPPAFRPLLNLVLKNSKGFTKHPAHNHRAVSDGSRRSNTSNTQLSVSSTLVEPAAGHTSSDHSEPSERSVGLHEQPDLMPGEHSRSRKLLYWCVSQNTSRTRLVPIDVMGMEERDLAPTLKRAYNNIRGVKRWLSLTCLHGATLIKYGMLVQEERVVAPLFIAIPDRTRDLTYEIHYYSSVSYEHIKWVEDNIAYRFYRPGNPGVEPLVKHLPKLVQKWTDSIPSEGYALYNIIAWSFLRTLLWFILVQIPPVIFAVRWLLGHHGDLQNAFEAEAILLMVLGMFVVQRDRSKVFKGIGDSS